MARPTRSFFWNVRLADYHAGGRDGRLAGLGGGWGVGGLVGEVLEGRGLREGISICGAVGVDEKTDL